MDSMSDQKKIVGKALRRTGICKVNKPNNGVTQYRIGWVLCGLGLGIASRLLIALLNYGSLTQSMIVAATASAIATLGIWRGLPALLESKTHPLIQFLGGYAVGLLGYTILYNALE